MKYEILTQELSVAEEEQLKVKPSIGKAIFYSFCAFPITAPITAVISIYTWGEHKGNPISVYFFVTFILCMFLIYLEYTAADRENKTKIQKANTDSSSKLKKLEQNLHLNIQETESLTKSKLPDHLRQASVNLNKAKIEYNENAYGPFWDEVEQAAQNLAQFNNAVSKIKNNTTSYYHELKVVSRHTFPETYPLSLNDLPDTKPVLTELAKVIRLGQTNYEFANIWEQRRTRQVLIAGFKTLGEAISNLGNVIESSMSELKTSISENIATLAREQQKTRESIDGMATQQKQIGDDQSYKLDNIQRKRKPPFG